MTINHMFVQTLPINKLILFLDAILYKVNETTLERYCDSCTLSFIMREHV